MRRAASWGYGRATGATPQQGTPPSGGGNGGGGAGAGLGSISSQSHSSAEINAERKEIDTVSKLLGSKSSREQLEGARRAVAAALTGDETIYRPYFPAVVKAVTAKSPDVKRLVYLFLSSTAERSPNEALLGINALKTELDGGSALQRGMALRALSSMRVPVIRQLVVLASKKCARDPSAYVRRCAAMAAVKLAASGGGADLEQEGDAGGYEAELVDVVQVLLKDIASPVVGAAMVAFNAICPDNWAIIHPVYRKVCRALVDMDAWSQMTTLNVLLRYARIHFARPAAASAQGDDGTFENQQRTLRAPVNRAPIPSADRFYSDEEEEEEEERSVPGKDGGSPVPSDKDGSPKQEVTVASKDESADGSPLGDATISAGDIGQGEDTGLSVAQDDEDAAEPMQDDHILLIRCARLILQSSNPGVVMAAASLMYHAAPESEWIGVARSMMLAIRMSPHAAPTILAAISKWAQDRPEMFKPFIRFFLVRSSDDKVVRALKLEIMTLIADESNTSNLLKEFQSYLRDSDKGFVADAVVALGHCAARLPSMSSPCMRALLRLSCYSQSIIADKSMMVMRVLAQSSPQTHAKGIAKALRKINRVRSPRARAEAVWMIGGLLPPPGHSISGKAEKLLNNLESSAQRALFASAANFASEAEATKIQMLCASARLFLRDPEGLRLLHGYLLELARYDMSFDVRDRGRFLKAVTSESQSPPPNASVETLDDVDKGPDALEEAGAGAEGVAEAASSEGPAVVPEDSKFIAISRKAIDILFCPKNAVHLPCVVEARDRFEIGSMSFMVRHSAPGYQPLAPFPRMGTDPRMRDPPIIEQQAPPQLRSSGTAGEPLMGAQRGEDFYDSESGSYTSGSESGSYTSGSESGSYTSGSESESDESDESDE